MNATIIKAVDAQGNVFFCTGRAGAAWVSPKRSDAFLWTVTGARAFATRHNANTSLHGLRLVVVVAED